jgi:MoaA/NifB/PqqE/SkfB family radical SAM enzyme
MADPKTIARGALAWLGIAPVPLAVGFEITHLCNLACAYCDRHTKLPNEMTLAQILEALAEFANLGMRHISLDGGEPLAHRHIDEVVDFLVRRGVRVYMNTNGILVPRKRELVAKLARVKISLDGPESCHDRMRGDGAYEKAVAGAKAARAAGVDVEFTCVVGAHNAHAVDDLVDFVEREGFQVVFQPLRNSLFLDSERDGSSFQLSERDLRATFLRIEARKRQGTGVANRWSSLRHFRRFPDDTEIPCAAGWINATLDPEGNLYHCGQVHRGSASPNVVRLGVRRALDELVRGGCRQCWCARVVEENYAWGGRLDRMLPPLRATIAPAEGQPRRLPILR